MIGLNPSSFDGMASTRAANAAGPMADALGLTGVNHDALSSLGFWGGSLDPVKDALNHILQQRTAEQEMALRQQQFQQQAQLHQQEHAERQGTSLMQLVAQMQQHQERLANQSEQWKTQLLGKREDNQSARLQKDQEFNQNLRNKMYEWQRGLEAERRKAEQAIKLKQTPGPPKSWMEGYSDQAKAAAHGGNPAQAEKDLKAYRVRQAIEALSNPEGVHPNNRAMVGAALQQPGSFQDRVNWLANAMDTGTLTPLSPAAPKPKAPFGGDLLNPLRDLSHYLGSGAWLPNSAQQSDFPNFGG